MIEIQPVSIEAAIAHQRAITAAQHLLSCSDYLIERLPEDVQELPITVDLTVLLSAVAEQISAARVKFETKEKLAPVATWRNQQQEEEAAPRPILGGAVVFDRGCRPTQEELAETIKAALAEILGKAAAPATA